MTRATQSTQPRLAIQSTSATPVVSTQHATLQSCGCLMLGAPAAAIKADGRATPAGFDVLAQCVAQADTSPAFHAI